MTKADVQIPVAGSEMGAYYAAPAGEKLPAVIVFQEIFGVNPQIRRITDLLAENGFAAVAINYYHRENPTLNEPYTDAGMQNGIAAAQKVGRATLRADIEATIAWLRARSEIDGQRIATWGFCMGGTVAFYSATISGISKAIAFYGGCLASPYFNGEAAGISDAAQIQAPLLLAFGAEDHFITEEHRAAIKTALDDAHKTYTMTVYPGEGHAFFRESSQAFSNPNVRAAWESVKAFLNTL